MSAVPGAVALVTGGQRGLGKALAQALLAAGADKVYVTARTPAPETDPRIVALPLEVTERKSVLDLAVRADDVTILINNAGEAAPGGILSAGDDSMWRVFDVNVFGLLRVAQEFAPILATNGGVLVDDSSRAFKAALSGPVEALQLRVIRGELRPTPV